MDSFKQHQIDKLTLALEPYAHEGHLYIIHDKAVILELQGFLHDRGFYSKNAFVGTSGLGPFYQLDLEGDLDVSAAIAEFSGLVIERQYTNPSPD